MFNLCFLNLFSDLLMLKCIYLCFMSNFPLYSLLFYTWYFFFLFFVYFFPSAWLTSLYINQRPLLDRYTLNPRSIPDTKNIAVVFVLATVAGVSQLWQTLAS